MITTVGVILLVAIFLGGFFLSDAIAGFIHAARGHDEDAVRRRLSVDDAVGGTPSRVEIIRRRTENAWYRKLPFQPALQSLAERAGTNTTLGNVWLQILIYSAFVFLALVLLIPIRFVLLALVMAPLIGFGLEFLNLRMKANRRCAKFEEQLPDALDLMVRSLRVGHPVTGAMSVIAKEMPAPIGPEFAIACEEVTYGHDVPTAFRAMATRVSVQDLSFLNVVLQVHQDTGGNLVESLASLSAVIRERFRMFRKVKSITVEGRVSAWILSLFPVVLIFLLKLIKPDFFDQMMELDVFPLIVIFVVFLLIVNVIAMRTITNIKV